MSNNPVLVNVCNRIISLVGGLALIATVTFKLSPEMQGFYYTFYSLTILRFFAELGLTVAVVQTIAHLSATPLNDERINAYTRFFIDWFKIAAVVLILCLVPAIFLFQARISNVEDSWTNVKAPWILLAVATGLSVVQYGLTSIVEGHKRLLNVSKIRLAVSSTNLFSSAILLMLDFQLWSIAIGAALSVVVGLALCLKEIDILKPTKNHSINIDWRHQIWPFQWRLAVSWASSFFIFYFLTPVVMRWHGPVPAGQVGLSLQLFQTMSSVAVIVVSTNSAVFGQLAALREFKRLGQTFRLGARRSFVVLLIILAAFWLCYASLDWLGRTDLRARLVKVELLYALTLATFGTHLFFLYNYYLRSYKDEGLWWVALINSATTVVLCVLFVPSHGASAAMIIFTVNSILFWIVLGSVVVKHRLKILQFGENI